MLSWRQKEAHHRLLQWAEREGRIKTVETTYEDKKLYNAGSFVSGNKARKDAYTGYKYGSNGKGHKPKPHQALTVKAR